MTLKSRINQNQKLKKFVHWLIVVPKQSRPRFWIRCLHRLFHSFKRGSVVRGRLDLFPFNKFEVGRNSIIESYSVINNGVGDVIIGDNATFGIGSVIIGPVNIGNDVIIAQHVAISGLNHVYSRVDVPISKQGVKTDPISIGDGSWIGANVTIASGVHIGKNSVIGAGSVVTKDIPDNVVAVGNPAKVIKKFSSDLMDWVGVRKELLV